MELQYFIAYFSANCMDNYGGGLKFIVFLEEGVHFSGSL